MSAPATASWPPPPPPLWQLATATSASASTSWQENSGCSIYQYVPLVYLAVVPIWGLLTAFWAWNTYRRNQASARDLHGLLFCVPMLQFLNGVLSLFYFSLCPWRGSIALIYTILWAVVTILKEPVIMLCLLLVAKGWCITRNSLGGREACIAGTTVALLYAAISVQLFLLTVASLVPMIVLYLVILTDIAASIFANLRVLKAQLIALRCFGIDPSTTPVHHKYVMFVRLAVLTVLYAGLKLTLLVVFSSQADGRYWIFVALHSLLDLLVAVAVGYTFRARPLNVHFQQVQQVAAELAEQMLPSITTVEVKPGAFSGEGLVAWSPELDLNAPRRRGQAQMPPTILVLNPGDIEVLDAPQREHPNQQAAPPSGADEPGCSTHPHQSGGGCPSRNGPEEEIMPSTRPPGSGGSTYLTWSLALPAHRHEALLLAPGHGDSSRPVSPASLGITEDMPIPALKALDLGGGDQRLIRAALEAGDKMGAERLLLSNHDAPPQKEEKKNTPGVTTSAAPTATPAVSATPAHNFTGEELPGRLPNLTGGELPGRLPILTGGELPGRLHILTGGELPGRLVAAGLLARSFPDSTFVTIAPDIEGRLTLAAGEHEMKRLLVTSNGRLTHALMIAKGSTDIHLAWLSSAGAPPPAGTSLSAVHKPASSGASTAADLFSIFINAPQNAPLRAAAARGRCALIFAGAAVHAFGGKEIAARGCYFRRVPLRVLRQADAARAHFERFVSLEWNAAVTGGDWQVAAGGGVTAGDPVHGLPEGGVGFDCTSGGATAGVGGESSAESEGRRGGVAGEGMGSLLGLGAAAQLNPVFVGALGVSKPRLDAVM